jgi:hypothetical protein
MFLNKIKSFYDFVIFTNGFRESMNLGIDTRIVVSSCIEAEISWWPSCPPSSIFQFPQGCQSGIIQISKYDILKRPKTVNKSCSNYTAKNRSLPLDYILVYAVVVMYLYCYILGDRVNEMRISTLKQLISVQGLFYMIANMYVQILVYIYTDT